MEASQTTLELWEHLFGDLEGFLVTFTGKQSADAQSNKLADPQQRSWRWPAEREGAAADLEAESDKGRDAYFGVHLFKRPGSRRAEDAAPITAPWVDGDGGRVPGGWAPPTAGGVSSPR